jgi:hypothetical protein
VQAIMINRVKVPFFIIKHLGGERAGMMAHKYIGGVLDGAFTSFYENPKP